MAAIEIHAKLCLLCLLLPTHG